MAGLAVSAGALDKPGVALSPRHDRLREAIGVILDELPGTVPDPAA